MFALRTWMDAEVRTLTGMHKRAQVCRRTYLDRIKGKRESEMGIADTGHLKKEGTKTCLQNGAYPSTITASRRSSSLIFDRNSVVLNGILGPICAASNCLKQKASRPTRIALEALMKRTKLAQQEPTTATCRTRCAVAEILASRLRDAEEK